ncbi:MAG: beta-ketoacyl synthase N-terminal-like domain-containing protein [Pasteurellaceae bacterium]|nr:beta-ketoacyl synthase N-terminal-like domain-containing protein [Pasteurellaceae bacterium]
MSVYLNGSSRLQRGLFSDHILQKRTACQLGQTVDLPYFNLFESPLLPLSELYRLIDEQIEQALAQAGWAKLERSNIPIFLGSTGYVIADCEYRLQHNQPLPTEYSLAVIGDHLRQRYQTEVYSLATSCTSSAQGIHYAEQMIRQGVCDKALVIGFESFNRLTFEHFHAMNLLADRTPYLPLFEPNGIVLGEGLACVALSNQPHHAFTAELLGFHSLTDNQNLTNSDERQFHHLIEQILAKAGLRAEQIAGVKVHGVGGQSDEMECQLLAQYFPQSRWIVAKAYLGHTLGATGVVETAFLQNCLWHGRLPSLQNLAVSHPLATEQWLPNGYYLNYFLGFGGSHVGWVLRWEKA